MGPCRLGNAIKQTIKLLAALISFAVVAGPNSVFANTATERGRNDAITSIVAHTFAYCRLEQGQGDDWLIWYYDKLNVPQYARNLDKKIPAAMMANNIIEVLKDIGPCSTILKYENEFGVNWFKEKYMENKRQKGVGAVK